MPNIPLVVGFGSAYRHKTSLDQRFLAVISESVLPKKFHRREKVHPSLLLLLHFLVSLCSNVFVPFKQINE